MFGVSFLEITLVGLVALIVVGPQKLPEMMRTAGEWVGKLRRITADMRTQTGIDDILREEGIDGVRELRTLLRGERGVAARRSMRNNYDAEISPPDLAVEFPMEGPDSHGALPDDLLQGEEEPTTAPEATPSTDASPPSANLTPPDLTPPSPTQPGPTPPPSSPSQPKPSASRPPPRPSQSPASPSRPPASRSLPPPRPGSFKPPRSIPPPPTTPRLSPPRAVTHPETPVSKSEPKITISEPPPVRSPKAPGKSS